MNASLLFFLGNGNNYEEMLDMCDKLMAELDTSVMVFNYR